MNVLALDTCLGAVSAAVRWRNAQGEWVAHGAWEARERGQAERLIPLVSQVMRDAQLEFADIDRIAVTVGPGSFTGMRVGVAAARGLSLSTGLPLVGTTSLAVMAWQARELLGAESSGRPLAVVIDARRGMLHLQLFPDSGLEAGPPRLLTPEDAVSRVGSRSAIVVGGGGPAIARAAATIGRQIETALSDLQPDARALAAMAADLTPADSVRPLYLRPADAKPPVATPLPRAVP